MRPRWAAAWPEGLVGRSSAAVAGLLFRSLHPRRRGLELGRRGGLSSSFGQHASCRNHVSWPRGILWVIPDKAVGA